MSQRRPEETEVLPRVHRALWAVLALWLVSAARAVEGDLAEFDQVAPGVYLRPGAMAVADAQNRGQIANLGFIVGTERVAVIDSGGSYAEGEALLDAVRRVTDLPIAWLILTHMHPDHALGAAAFADHGIQIIGHVNLGDALQRRRDAYLNPLEAYLGSAAAGTRVVVPDSVVIPGRVRELNLGGRTLRLHAHPTAHTNNDLSVHDTKANLLWLSDLLFVDRIPVVDGSLLGWLRLIDDLAGLDAAVVVPGHGPVNANWKDDLERQREYLQTLADGVRGVLRAGGDISQAVRDVGRQERDHWRLFDEYHGRNVTAAFVELEWE